MSSSWWAQVHIHGSDCMSATCFVQIVVVPDVHRCLIECLSTYIYRRAVAGGLKFTFNDCMSAACFVQTIEVVPASP